MGPIVQYGGMTGPGLQRAIKWIDEGAGPGGVK